MACTVDPLHKQARHPIQQFGQVFLLTFKLIGVDNADLAGAKVFLPIGTLGFYGKATQLKFAHAISYSAADAGSIIGNHITGYLAHIVNCCASYGSPCIIISVGSALRGLLHLRHLHIGYLGRLTYYYGGGLGFGKAWPCYAVAVDGQACAAIGFGCFSTTAEATPAKVKSPVDAPLVAHVAAGGFNKV